MDVCLPAHGSNGESDLSRLVAMPTVRKRPAGELPQDVVQSVDRLHSGGGVLKRRVSQRAFRDVDKESNAVGDVLIERRFQAEDQSFVQSILVHSSGLPVHTEERAVRGNELAEGRDKLQQAVRTSSFLDEPLVADPRDHPGLPRAHDRKRVLLSVESRSLVRISPVEKRARLVADEFDERRDAECLADVVHVYDEDCDAHENEYESRYDRDAWHVARAVAVDGHLAEREDGVDESRDEEADRELARLVPKNALHDAGRKLTHGELDDDHRDRENERGQAHHRGGDGRKDVGRGIRTPDEAGGKRLVVEVAVDSDRSERESHPGEYAEHWHEPQARLEVDEQLRAPHGIGRLPSERAAEPEGTATRKSAKLLSVANVLSVETAVAVGGRPVDSLGDTHFQK